MQPKATSGYVVVALLTCLLFDNPLQRYIRGSGLAYGAHCGLDLEAGFVSFTLYRVCYVSHALVGLVSDALVQSSNSIEAFKQAASVIKGLTDGSVRRVTSRSHPMSTYLQSLQIAFDETVLDAAKSSIVFGVAKSVSTPGRAVRCLP